MLATGAANLWTLARNRDHTLRLRSVPLFAAAIAFALGVCCALRWQSVDAPPFACALLLALTVAAQFRAPRIAIFAALALLCAVGCWSARIQPAPTHAATIAPFADGLSRRVEAHIIGVRTLAQQPAQSSPQDDALPVWLADAGAWQPEHGTPAVSVDLSLDRIEDVTPDTATMRQQSGILSVTVFEDAAQNISSLACGERVAMPLRLRLADTYRTPGAFSHAALLAQQGIDAEASVRADRITLLPRAAKPNIHCRLQAWQQRAAARLQQLAADSAGEHIPAFAKLHPADAAMLAAMLLGDRSALTQPLRAGFERTGTFHLFVVSGMHVALLAAAVFWLLRRLRLPLGVVTLATIAVTAVYAVFTGFGAPVERALLMTTVFLLARWQLRSITALQALGAAALAALAADPRALFTASFQMTCLVVLAFAGLAAPISARTLGPWLHAVRTADATWMDLRLPPRIAQFRIMLRMFSTALAAAFGAWLRPWPRWLLVAALGITEFTLAALFVEAVMALPMAIYFHRVTAFALPANLLLLPLVPALAVSAVVTFAVALLSLHAAAIPAAATAVLLHFIDAAIAALSHARAADLHVPAPAAWCVALALLMLAAATFLLRARPRIAAVAGIAAVLAIPLLALWPSSPLLHRGLLEVTALDVGQGDSLLVVSPDGHTLLVDAGGPVGIAGHAGQRSSFDTGEDVVAPYLWSRRIRRLDAVLLTHAHSDHMGGMPAVLRDLRPRELWLSVIPSNAPDLHALLAEAGTLGIAVRFLRAGDGFDWHGVLASVLAPEAAYVNPGAPANNDSLVMRLDAGRASVLLAGDAERPEEDTMLAEGRLDDVTLLKVGHHGSHTSTNPEFLDAIHPREAIISVGRHNTFGHPRADVLARLASAHVQTWRTDREGAVAFLLRPADGGISAAQPASN